MRTVFVIALVAIHSLASAQYEDHGFPYGKVTHADLDMKVYEKDTAAAAVVLDEFGEAFMDNENAHNLVFRYHAKIKILKKEGLDYANFVIYLYKNSTGKEAMRSAKASTFNLENGSIREIKLPQRSQINEEIDPTHDARKFALLDVRVGSVIEVDYKIESPFKFNFRSWPFQSEIPKIASEYWALIPANYKYHTSLRGFLKLSKNESELKRNWYSPGGGRLADCILTKFGMADIPAFVEEEYMTAKSNYVSCLNFELAELLQFDGRKDKFTKEWKDVDDELRLDNGFGVQIKRGKGVLDREVDQCIAGVTDDLTKAQKIYDFIKGWYRWNEKNNFTSQDGIKKAFEAKTGDVADINLSLVAALQYAGLSADPMILSTRENGLVTSVYPVLSDFNYVIAKLNVGDKVYLLDATDDLLSFGLIPDRCLNGKGRVMTGKESYWYDTKPAEKDRQVSMISLKLTPDGKWVGTVENTHFGYSAYRYRKMLAQSGEEKFYAEKMANNLHNATLIKQSFTNVDDLTKPLIMKFELELERVDDLTAGQFYFNPFITLYWQNNPFRSAVRLYPVDFGVPIEQVIVFNLEYPATYELAEIPEPLGLTLPTDGGRYIYDVKSSGNTVMMNSNFVINRPVYSSKEYFFLKELFDRVVAVQKTDLVFKKKA
jgi:hypothetical protein